MRASNVTKSGKLLTTTESDHMQSDSVALVIDLDTGARVSAVCQIVS